LLVFISPEDIEIACISGNLRAGALSATLLILSTAVFFTAKQRLYLPLTQLETLVFVMLVFTGHLTVYLVRLPCPSGEACSIRCLGRSSLVLSSAADLIVVTVMATKGILMTSVSLSFVA
jgi:H+-transporting ATPase